MRVTLTDEAQRYARRFADVTGVTPIDLLVFEPTDEADDDRSVNGRSAAESSSDRSAESSDQSAVESSSGRRAGYDAAAGDHVGTDGRVGSDPSRGTRLVVVVPAGRKGEAVGPDGATVERAERLFDARIDLIEHAESPAEFVANALAPAAVRDVTVSAMGVAFAEVLEADRGVAIGRDGANIEVARRLASRHFDIDDVQLA